MHPTHKDSFNEAAESAMNSVRFYLTAALKIERAEHIVKKIAKLLSKKTKINAISGTIWIDVFNHEQLEVCLAMADRWEKSNTVVDCISYEATIDDVYFSIRAHEHALPPTCALVEEEVLIPASIQKRMVVRCKQLGKEVVPDEVGGPVAIAAELTTDTEQPDHPASC